MLRWMNFVGNCKTFLGKIKRLILFKHLAEHRAALSGRCRTCEFNCHDGDGVKDRRECGIAHGSYIHLLSSPLETASKKLRTSAESMEVPPLLQELAIILDLAAPRGSRGLQAVPLVVAACWVPLHDFLGAGL